MLTWDFPGNPVVKTLCCQCRGHGAPFLVGGTRIPHAVSMAKRLKKIKNIMVREFLGSPVVRTWCPHCSGLDSVPGWGIMFPQVMQPN